MGKSCCVPGCKSNYGQTDTSCFVFPKDKTLQEKWLRYIRYKDYKVSKHSVVCIKHFDKRFIVTEDIFQIIGDDPISIPRKRPKLTKDAYPTIFPNQPSYYNVKLPKARKTPAQRQQELELREEKKFKQWCEGDKICSYDSFVETVLKKNTYPFTCILRNNHVLFIKFHNEDVPSFTVSFKVTSSLDVKIYYKDLCLPAERFKAILSSKGESHNLKCDRWTKFDSLVSYLSSYCDE